ncbi:MAG: TIGR03435 family protein [Candidatus Solibacter sp.]
MASIKPAAPIDAANIAQVHIGVQIDGAQAHISYFSLKELTRVAYRVKDHQIIGPDWMGAERYDIHATIPAGVTREQVPEMLQTLLEQRFQLKTHRGAKEVPVYALVVARNGLKMKESPLDEDTSDAGGGRGATNVQATGGRNGTTVKFGRGAYFSFADNKIEARKISMAQMTDMLSRFVERPVVDQTGLTGTYDITVELTPEDYRALLIRSAIYAGVQLPPEALRLLEGASDEQLFRQLQSAGLKMEPRKAPIDVIIVDSVNKTPTDN